MNFEWDEEKREMNIEKHGVDFIDAIKIFSQPFLEKQDTRETYGEERFVVVGTFENDYFVVIYTWREGNRRIISAWKAGTNEKRAYHKRHP